MLNWLKEILGDTYSEDIDKKVSSKVGELFVAKGDFNKKLDDIKSKDSQITDLNSQIKSRDKQLDELKKIDKEGLEAEISKLQEANKATKTEYEAKISKMQLDAAVDAAIGSSGAKDALSVRAHLADFLKDAKVGSDGTITGMTEKLDALKADENTSFLFAETKKGEKVKLSGARAAENGSTGAPPATKKPEEMTYEDFVLAEESKS